MVNLRILKKIFSDTGNVYHMTDELSEEEAIKEYNRLIDVGWSPKSLEIVEIKTNKLSC